MKKDRIFFGRILLVCFVSLFFNFPLLAQEVLTRDDFINAFSGRWSVPSANGPDSSQGGNDYRRTTNSSGVFTNLIDGKMKIKTHSNDVFGYALIDPPAPGFGNDIPKATVLDFGELSQPSLGNTPNSSGTRQHGWFTDSDGNEYVSMKAYYAVSGNDYPSQMKNGLGFYVATGTISVPDISNAYHHNKIAGYMCAPPASQAERWDYMLGLVGTPGSGSSSGGISLIGVKWNDDGSGEKPFGEALIMHDQSDERKADYWDSILQIRGCAWIETTVSNVPKQGIIFFANRSKGALWYGDGDGSFSTVVDGVSVTRYYNKASDWPASSLYVTDTRTEFTVNDPYSSSKGYHAEDGERGFFIVDARKLEKGNFQVYPEEWVSMEDLGWLDNVNNWQGDLVETSNPKKDVSASFDANSGKLRVSVSYGYRASNYESASLFLEFEFSPSDGGSTPVPSAPQALEVKK